MKNKLQNGKKYNLSDLFSQDRRIIIPDLQRDYTWGDEKHGKDKIELVSRFCKNLLEQHQTDSNNNIQLGMIYAYENPINFINLADGQQRISTLYLLIGMLYRATKKEILKTKLISDFELNKDDQEPYLQYSIRETTLYFLSDLVVKFFLNGNYNTDDIEKQKWYFKEYNNDPSIQSMLKALKIIEKLLKNNNNLTDFADWLINKVEFFYFDMLNREHGEEMFVVINTTGEPLTTTENLKPILLGDIENKEFNNQWEEREKFFWQNKKEKEQEADNGLNDFLTWYVKIQEKQETINSYKYFYDKKKDNKIEIELENLNTYFKGLKNVIELLENNNIQKQFGFINKNENVKGIIGLRSLEDKQKNNILLPFLFFNIKFKNDNELKIKFLRRLRKNYFDLEYKDRNHNYLDWRYVLQIIEKSENIDNILTFNIDKLDKIQNIEIAKWYNTEEQIKDKLKLEHKEEINKWEDYDNFMGDLSILFKTYFCNDNCSVIPKLQSETDYNIEELKRIFVNYEKTIGVLKNEENENCIKLSNLFRLFRLFTGIVKIGHIKGTSGIAGVKFSTFNRNHFNNLDFIKLIKTNNLELYCIQYIRVKIKEEKIFDLVNYSAYKFIKSWLTLKVFYANEKHKTLAYYEGKNTGVATYWDIETNKLTSEYEFSLGNSICGFAVRSGFGRPSKIHYTGHDFWLSPNIIDTPFSGIKYQNFEDDKKVTKEEIEKNQNIINSIIDNIMKE